MAAIDIVDETFLVADPAAVAAVVSDPGRWARWWSDLDVELIENRGAEGVRLAVGGALVGTSEIWLEPFGDGVILHYYLRAAPTRRGSRTEPAAAPGRRVVERLRRRHSLAFKRAVLAAKDELEGERAPGAPRPKSRTGLQSPS